MKIVIFYEKPGCTTNKKQKKSLRKAGCTVIERDLLNHGMNADELRSFFPQTDVKEWFNPNAPKIKSGEIDLSVLDIEAAINLLFIEPILIKRPLIIANNKRICGFDQEHLEGLLNISLHTQVSNDCSAVHESCVTDKRKVS